MATHRFLDREHLGQKRQLWLNVDMERFEVTETTRSTTRLVRLCYISHWLRLQLPCQFMTV